MAKMAYHNDEPEGVPPNAPKDAVRAEFGRRLYQRMVAAGINQSELARRAAAQIPGGTFGRDNVSNYVRGRVMPGPLHLRALSRALGCEDSDLLPAAAPRVEQDAPPLELKDAGGGKAWLRVNQAVPWPVAVEVARILHSAEAA